MKNDSTTYLDPEAQQWLSAVLGKPFRAAKHAHSHQDEVYKIEVDDATYYFKIATTLTRERDNLKKLAPVLSVPQVIDFHESHEGRDFLLMSEVPGKNLVELIGEWPDAEIVDTFATAVRQLHEVGANAVFPQAHDHDVLLHGDMALPNIIISEQKQIGYIDFGQLSFGTPELDLADAIWSLQRNLGPAYGELFLQKYGHVPRTPKIQAALAFRYDATQPIGKVIDEILVQTEALMASRKLDPQADDRKHHDAESILEPDEGLILLGISIPEYRANEWPDILAIGPRLDHLLEEHFLGRDVVLRCLGARDHPGKTVDELVSIIAETGTDRYDSNRAGQGYDVGKVQGKRVDFFGTPTKVRRGTNIFTKELLADFYHGALGDRGYAIRIDIVIVYDAAKLTNVEHLYGEDIAESDGFVFHESDHKKSALLGVIKIL